MTLAQINARLATLTNGMVQLERGKGYQYFIFDDHGAGYDTRSEYVCYLNQLSGAEWIARGVAYYIEKTTHFSELGDALQAIAHCVLVREPNMYSRGWFDALDGRGWTGAWAVRNALYEAGFTRALEHMTP